MIEFGSVNLGSTLLVNSKVGSFYDSFSDLGSFPTRFYLITTLALGCLMLLAERRSHADLTLSPRIPSPESLNRTSRKPRIFHPHKESSFVSNPSSLSEVSLSRPTCSPEEKRKIAEIVDILDLYSMVTIGLQTYRLDTLKKEINQVHPLAFLETIFSNGDLKNKVRNVFENSWKGLHQKGFLDGIAEGLGSLKLEQLDPYLGDWAQSLGTSKAKVRPLIEERNWRGLTDHLLGLR